MNFRRLWAIIQKEWKEILRDRLSFSLAFIMPVMLLLLLGYGVNLDVENIPFVVQDLDGTAQSRDYAHRFIHSKHFDFQGYSFNDRDLDRLLMTNRIRFAMLIPEHFERDLLTGRQVDVQYRIDGTFPMRAEVTSGYITAITSAFNSDFLSESMGMTLASSPVQLQVRYLYNQSLRSILSFGPKLIMLVLMISSPILSALVVVREKETGAIYNIRSSVVSRSEFLLGKMIPNCAVSIINSWILWLLVIHLFDIPFKGSFLAFFAVSVLYLICTTEVGIFISVMVRSQIAAMTLTTILTVVPSVFYSGLLIPIASLSAGARFVAHLLPSMYYGNAITSIFMKGIGISSFWPDVISLMIYSIALYTIIHFSFHKRSKS